MGKEIKVVEMKAINYAAKVASFKEKNAQFDLDFVELGTFLKISKTGKLQSKDDDAITFDAIKGVILEGKEQFTLWGKDDTPQDGELLIKENELEEAEAKFEELCAADDMFGALYSLSDIGPRYIITFVAEDGNLYAINMSKSSKYELGKHSKFCFVSLGVGLAEVVTKIGIQEKTGGKNSWLAFKFDYVSTLPTDTEAGEE